MAATDNTMSWCQPGLDSPASSGVAVTPDNSNDLAYVTRGVYVGGSGDLKVDLAASGTVTFTAVQAGTLLPVRAKRVYATGTTATLIIALW